MKSALKREENPLSSLILFHSPRHGEWVLGASHPTQGVRYVNAHALIAAACESRGVGLEVREPIGGDVRTLIESVHTPEYVASVLDDHVSDEWVGSDPVLAELAQLLVSGTVDALDSLLAGETLTAVHLPGAKHHAHLDHSSGFCVFNDLAVAAYIATERGLRVAILDFDAHHGDGTEALLRDNPQVLTFSIHQWGIFPGTGGENDPAHHVYNAPLRADQGTGDVLKHYVLNFADLAMDFGAEVVFIAAGADGHHRDPLASLQWENADYIDAMQALRAKLPAMPILMGGAGGYRPHDDTPAVWRDVALSLAC